MGLEKVSLSFKITKEKFLHLLLLGGEVGVLTRGKEKLVLFGIKDHHKFGQPGVEDGSNHTFDTIVTYKKRQSMAEVRLNSLKSGKIYQGHITFWVQKQLLSDIDVPD